MRIYSCKDRFEDMMTCVYEAWCGAIQNGSHENIRLIREPVYQKNMFDEYIHVDADDQKVNKVIRSIRKSISDEAYVYVFYAAMSECEDALQAIYNFLIIGFKAGSRVCSMYTNPYVMRIIEIKKRVGNESHFFREFARFTSLNNKAYICHLEPKNNVIMLVGAHFADRMPSEHWIIVDDCRHIAVVHPKDEDNYLRYLTDEEYITLRHTEDYSDDYTDMWKTFFRTISIKERENPTCQRNMFPKWMRKHAVEFDGEK